VVDAREEGHVIEIRQPE